MTLNTERRQMDLSSGILRDKFNFNDGKLLKNGEPMFVIMGDYPYYRDDPKNWLDRLAKLKHSGINTIQCAIPWRHHVNWDLRTKSQKFDFEGNTAGNRNFKYFIELCKKIGLWVSMNVGPFSDPSLTYGGMPDFVNPKYNKMINSYRNHLYLRGHQERSKNRWKPLKGEPLPSPNDPVFLDYVQDFFNQINQSILKPYAYPAGPILFIQLGYQGYYSEGKAPYWVEGDYNLRNIHAFWNYLRQQHQTIEQFNAQHRTNFSFWNQIIPPIIYPGNNHFSHPSQLLLINEWIQFNTVQYIEWLRLLKKMLGFPVDDELREENSIKNKEKEIEKNKEKTLEKNKIRIPEKNKVRIPEKNIQKIPEKKKEFPIILIQWESPIDLRVGLDAWLSRINLAKIEQQAGVVCTFTNWSKAENYHKTSFARHSIMMKYAERFNKATNWGLRKHSSTKFEYAFTSLYQTLLTCALNTTGYTQTPLVGTKSWSSKIDSTHKKPYPTYSAIDAAGISGNKLQLISGINKYFGDYYGSEFLQSKRETMLALGLYMPYVELAAYGGHDPKLWKRRHLNIKHPPVFGQDVWTQFHLAAQHLGMDYKIINLEHENIEAKIPPALNIHLTDLIDKGNESGKKRPKILIFASSFFLSREVQKNLVSYIKRGGIVFLFGQLPDCDEHFAPCTVLKDFVANEVESCCLSKKSAKHQICIFPKRKGILLFHARNPFELKKSAWFYFIDFITRALFRINFKLPHTPVIDLEAIPYPELMAWLSQDRLNPKLQLNSLKTINLLLRFLQSKGFYRNLDISVRTDFIFRHKIRVFVFQHPSKNIQHVFIFSLQTHWTLPVSIHIFHPESGFSSRIRTHLVGHTAQLLRIEEGRLTACIYNGVNPISHQYQPLFIKVNRQIVKSRHPLDLIFLSNRNQMEFFSAHGRFKGFTSLLGFKEKMINIRPRDHLILKDLGVSLKNAD
ncbi:beta-galactosidase [Candidatus Harpocratesius sp.]